MADTLWIARLLHVLMFVYWLGGDIGAFYAANLVVDARLSQGARAAAWRILAAVDLAPNSCIILALPTGLLLANAKGWLALPWPALLGLWLVALAWVATVWRAHARHGGSAAWRQTDFLIRVVFLLALLVAGGLGLSGFLVMPGFICWKLLILAGTLGLGLVVRQILLGPFMAALVALLGGTHTQADDVVIATGLARARIAVIALWGLLLAAAVIGLRAG